jgi:hypothetical protein
MFDEAKSKARMVQTRVAARFVDAKLMVFKKKHSHHSV